MTQFMFKTEATPGATVTPTLTLPMKGDGDGLDIGKPILESDSMFAGMIIKPMDATNGGLTEIGGSTAFELSNIGATSLFRHMLGGKSTTGSGPYTHVFTPGSLSGLSATLQMGVNMDGTATIPKTLSGAKVQSWSLSGDEGAFLTLSLDWIAQRGQMGSRTVSDGVAVSGSNVFASAAADFTKSDIDRDVSNANFPAGTYIIDVKADGSEAYLSADATGSATGQTVVIGKALATASNPSGIHYYKMAHTRLKIDGASVPFKGFELTGDNALVRDYVGGSYNSAEVKVDGDTERTLGGTITTAFSNMAQVERYLAGTPFDVEITASNGADSIKIEGYARYDGGAIPMAQRSRVMVDSPIRLFAETTNASALTITMVNSDSTAD